jgi:hypothetical protein
MRKDGYPQLERTIAGESAHEDLILVAHVRPWTWVGPDPSPQDRSRLVGVPVDPVTFRSHDLTVPHHLPTGIVTFLFMDIEGSTHLVQALGAEYRGVWNATPRSCAMPLSK